MAGTVGRPGRWVKVHIAYPSEPSEQRASFALRPLLFAPAIIHSKKEFAMEHSLVSRRGPVPDPYPIFPSQRAPPPVVIMPGGGATYPSARNSFHRGGTAEKAIGPGLSFLSPYFVFCPGGGWLPGDLEPQKEPASMDPAGTISVAREP